MLDASGKVVCPGFVDVHAHSALMLLAEPRHEPKVHQGVTTELIGIDGNSYAPFPSKEDLGRFIRLYSGLEGNPPLKGTWSSVSEYLSMFDRKVSVNVAYLVGNSPLRIGGVGWTNRPASSGDMETMKSLLRESMEEGAFGMSTGLDYPPGSYADTDELVELSREVARLGGIYHTHVRYQLGDRYLDPFKEAIHIGRSSGVPVHLTHFSKFVIHPGGGRGLLALVEGARDEGLDVTFDCFPYRHGGGPVVIIFPQWAHDGGPDHLVEVLRSTEGRERLKNEEGPWSVDLEDAFLTYFQQPHNRVYEGMSLADIAQMREQDPTDALCDLLLDEDLHISWTVTTSDPMTVPDFVVHPLQMVASDALLIGDHPNPQSHGTYPFILSEYVREEGKLSLAEAIRKMTSFPAQRLGLPDRGLLRDGMAADIVVFSLDNIRAHATREEPRRFSTGVEYVIVNGEVVMDRGVHTGALPGRALKHGRAP